MYYLMYFLLNILWNKLWQPLCKWFYVNGKKKYNLEVHLKTVSVDYYS